MLPSLLAQITSNPTLSQLLVFTTRVQQQSLPIASSSIGGSASGAALGVPGLAAPVPYGLEMAGAGSAAASGAPRSEAASAAQASQTNGAAAGESLRQGPLNPNFKVDEQVPERYSMGRGSVDVSPGREVCIDPSGCGAGVSANSMSQLQLQGPDLRDGVPQTRFAQAMDRLAYPLPDGQLRDDQPTAAPGKAQRSIRAMGSRLMGWLSSSL